MQNAWVSQQQQKMTLENSFSFVKILLFTSMNNAFVLLGIICLKENNFIYFSLLGVDKLFSYAISEWLNDIKKNQLPGILGGVGPMHSLVQLGKLILISVQTHMAFSLKTKQNLTNLQCIQCWYLFSLLSLPLKAIWLSKRAF